MGEFRRPITIDDGPARGTILPVTAAGKLLARMRNNPRDWSIEDLKALAKRHGVDWRQPGTSHVTFSYPGGPPLTVPSHKPIKPIYIMKFIVLLDAIGASDAD